LATSKNSDGEYLFSEKQLVDNYIAFLVAGCDPTANAITFALYELCRYENQEILKQAQDEIDGLFDEISHSIDEDNLDKLTYLNMIIKETLRIHSPGFGTVRKLKENVTINNITLPKNTSLYIWNYPVHRDPKVWPEPDVFNPENFRNANYCEAKMNGSYFPFSHGPRKCLGFSLALTEMRFVLATLIHHYNFSLSDNFKMVQKSSFTLCSSNGLPVYLTKRL
jgi:cholesterol 24(S)-hydroxylase/benzoate 4-monooxygenase